MSDEANLLVQIRTRVDGQRREHWVEFAVILASANAFLALVLFGRIVERGRWDHLGYVAIVLAVASCAAVVLAYSSVQIGSLTELGTLGVVDVVLSFIVAGSQLALFAIPANAFDPTLKLSDDTRANRLPFWLLAYAIFGLSAAISNNRANVRREKTALAALMPHFHKRERQDANVAFLAGMASLLLFVGSLKWPYWGVPSGAVLALLFSIAGLRSQSVLGQLLQDDLGPPTHEARNARRPR